MPELDATKLKDAVKKLFPKDRLTVIMVLAGLTGMLLISLPQLFSGKSGSAPAVVQDSGVTAPDSGSQYAEALERKLAGLIADIDGVGRAKVMVMLENSGESVYAQEEKRNVDKTTQSAYESESATVVEKEENERKYVMVDNGYGQRQALVTTRLEPKIQGVVIVCEGAENAHVKQRLINVVTTALRIPSTRVCVEKIKQSP